MSGCLFQGLSTDKTPVKKENNEQKLLTFPSRYFMRLGNFQFSVKFYLLNHLWFLTVDIRFCFAIFALFKCILRVTVNLKTPKNDPLLEQRGKLRETLQPGKTAEGTEEEKNSKRKSSRTAD